MSFKIGQQVISLKDFRGQKVEEGDAFSMGPSKDEIVTCAGHHGDYIFLEEYPLHSEGGPNVFASKRFRPLADIGISQIEQILEVKKEGTKTD